MFTLYRTANNIFLHKRSLYSVKVLKHFSFPLLLWFILLVRKGVTDLSSRGISSEELLPWKIFRR